MQCNKMRDQIVHSSFDHLIGEREQLVRHCQAERLDGLAV
jgi:hypothetical protein